LYYLFTKSVLRLALFLCIVLEVEGELLFGSGTLLLGLADEQRSQSLRT
jgi:hypothetical protein